MVVIAGKSQGHLPARKKPAQNETHVTHNNVSTTECACPRAAAITACALQEHKIEGGHDVRDSGPRCEIDIDECVAPVPRCFHGGTCLDAVGGFTCICPQGYVGDRCEGDVNECLFNPCDPRGTLTCVEVANGYQCQCHQNYTGQKCEKLINVCDNSPCENGGLCAVAANRHLGFACTCPKGYSGPTCNTNVLLYDKYCLDHFANGHCEKGCDNAECGWDGGDCSAHESPQGKVILVLSYNASVLHRNDVIKLLRFLSMHLHARLRLAKDNDGDMLFRLCKENDPQDLSPEKLERWKYEIAADTAYEHGGKNTIGCVLYVEIFGSNCPFPSCIDTSEEAAHFLEALNETEQQYTFLEVSHIPAVVIIGVKVSRKRQHGTIWLPSGFSRHRVQEGSRRREPVGEDSVRLKPLKHDSGYDDSSPEGVVPPKSRRLKLNTDPTILDHRQWSQQHIDAGVRFPQCLALTPPQEDPEGRDIDVRGPDGVTPLMSAICAGGGLEPVGGGADPQEVESSASVIADLISQGASLNAQTDSTGETALHLAARFSRQDAIKCMLDAGADTNVQDRLGRTPLHTAIAADALGVFQTLLRCRQTDIDARMHDGCTPLILASRLPVQNMVEELVACGSDIGAADNRGKSALHWAAAVNNVPAMKTLLSNGANKDLQDKRDQTALFLAAREGSYEAVQLLLEHQADRDLSDHVGHQPRHAARDRGHRDILRLFEESSQLLNRSTPAVPNTGPPQLKKTPRPRPKEPVKPPPLPHIDLSSSCYHSAPPGSAPPYLHGAQSETSCCQSHLPMVNYGGNCQPYPRIWIPFSCQPRRNTVNTKDVYASPSIPYPLSRVKKPLGYFFTIMPENISNWKIWKGQLHGHLPREIQNSTLE
ncbi:unnamed protein product [Ranitomeya imitator]|uniref:Notch n=1 Tax=Ranitomeya imitator TaxID=111125 RepID=A0ABN9M4W6_9NEOB|nr:unnamed protein product [Ranitomeya imitator]